MELKITEQKENLIFKRKEIKAVFYSEKSPSREEVAKLLSEKFSVPASNISIKKILGSFGSKAFNVEANIYSSREEKEIIEIKKKRDTEIEKKAAEIIVATTTQQTKDEK